MVPNVAECVRFLRRVTGSVKGCNNSHGRQFVRKMAISGSKLFMLARLDVGLLKELGHSA